MVAETAWTDLLGVRQSQRTVSAPCRNRIVAGPRNSPSNFRSRIAGSAKLFDAVETRCDVEPSTGRENRPPIRRNGPMAEAGTLTFSDPEAYAAAFSDAHVKLTITGAGDFKARLTRLKLEHLEIHQYCENLPRIAYISLLPQRIFLSSRHCISYMRRICFAKSPHGFSQPRRAPASTLRR